MAELPACRIHSLVILSLSPTVATCYICFQSPENSQLVIANYECLQTTVNFLNFGLMPKAGEGGHISLRCMRPAHCPTTIIIVSTCCVESVMQAGLLLKRGLNSSIYRM